MMENDEIQETEGAETVVATEVGVNADGVVMTETEGIKAEVVEVVEVVGSTSDVTDDAPDEQPSEFKKLRDRLEEIASMVDSDEISLDEALDLYEEAVVLGLQATDMLDIGITAQEEAQARMLGENPAEMVEPEDSENEQASATNNVPETHTTTAADENQVS